MSPVTDNPNDPGIGKDRGDGTGQYESYIVLSSEERAKGFVRPVRTRYQHKTCGAVTWMAEPIAETYARQPDYYTHTYCGGCRDHFPVGEFVWDGTNEVVGS